MRGMELASAIASPGEIASGRDLGGGRNFRPARYLRGQTFFEGQTFKVPVAADSGSGAYLHETIQQKQQEDYMAQSFTRLGSAVRIAGIFICGAGMMSISAVPARAQAFADLKAALVDYSRAEITPHKTCEAIGKFKSKSIATIAAMTVPAAGAAPAHCRVTGLLSPEIAFEVSLPAKWNGRFYMIGNGGLAGEAMDDPGRVAQRNAALQFGFAFAQTNTGHDARKEPSGTFVVNNPQKAVDYAWRAVHLTALTTKDITKEYYGKSVSHAYWNSCSNGGRQGLLEAQRFPNDFDGIIANAPWVDQTGFTIGAMWNQKALSEAPVTPAKLALVGRKVMEKCDAIDGLKDGLIDDPRKCSFDPVRDVPTCTAGDATPNGAGPDCLTAAEAAAIAKVYSGPQSNGKPFFPGYMPGSEGVIPGPNGAGMSGWMNLIASAQPGAKPADFNLAEGIMRFLVFKPPMPDYDYKTFDYDR
ncbi:MAG TPA: tannase/feruloyl esterase family alpha/beta hydrolase, partial [Bryobacteraceae bacterium]|nr:tannase/feruloyl esterase family alpha/beta hydrolase [Bryobacteraceae bacterium]